MHLLHKTVQPLPLRWFPSVCNLHPGVAGVTLASTLGPPTCPLPPHTWGSIGALCGSQDVGSGLDGYDKRPLAPTSRQARHPGAQATA